MAFTEAERARILERLGYPSFANQGVARGFGHPSAGPYSDQVFAVFDRLSPEGEEAVRRDLAEIDCIETELRKLRSKAAITATSDVKFDIAEGRKHLRSELSRYTQKLSADLGAPINPRSVMGGAPRVRNMP